MNKKIKSWNIFFDKIVRLGWIGVGITALSGCVALIDVVSYYPDDIVKSDEFKDKQKGNEIY